MISSQSTSRGEELIHQIKNWFTPPVFPEDRNKTRRAKMLSLALIYFFAFIPLITISNLIGGNTSTITIWMSVPVFLTCLIFVYWLRHGRIELAGFGIIGLGLVGTTVGVASLGTIRAPATALFLLMIITSGLLFELRGMIATTLISSLLVGGLIIAENMGFLPAPNYTVTIAQWINYTLFFGWAGGLTFASIQSMHNALNLADGELQGRKLAEAELTKHRDHLEELVKEGTSELETRNILLSKEISEHKQAKEALKAEKDLAQKYLNIADVILVVLDTEARITMLNRKGYQVLRYEEGELLGKDWIQTCLRPEDRKIIQEVHKRIFAGKIVASEYFENLVVTKNGEERLIRWHNTTIKDDSGQIIGTLSSGEDITERKLTEQKLAEQAIMLANINDAVIGTDDDYRINYWNQAAEKMYGYHSDEVIGKIGILKPEFIDVTSQEALKQLESTGELKVELIHMTKDGRKIIIDSTNRILYDKTGRAIGNVSINRDITERKRWETALQESEAKLAAIFHASPDLMAVTRIADGKILEVNDGYPRMLGYSREESIGKTTAELAIWADPEDRKKFADTLRSSGWIMDFETRLRRKDGSIITVIDSARTMTLGGEDCILSVVHDITERKKAEEALHEAWAYNRSLIEASLDPLVTIGPDGKVTDVNNATIIATGFQYEELVGTDFSDYFTEPNKARTGYEKVFREGYVRDYPLEIRHRDGHVVPVLYNASVYRDNNGQVVGVFAAARDITERKRSEQMLRSNIKELENSRRSIKQSQSLLMSIVASPKEIVIFALDREYRYLIFNQNHKDTMKSIWGVDIELGHSMLEYIKNPEDSDKTKLNFDRALRGETFIIDEVYGDIALQRRYYENHYSPILESDCSVSGLTVFLTDITERKRAEEALRESENTYRAIFGNTGTAMVIVEDDNIISLANSEFERLSGYRKEEIEGKVGWIEFVMKDDLEMMMQQHKLRRINPDAALKSYEFRARDRSGNIKNILLHIDIIPGTKKSVASWTDITEIKQIEEELRSSNQLLDGIINTIPVRVFWKDKEGIFLGCNTIFAKDAGFADPKDIVGKDDYQMVWHDQAELYRADDRQVIESGQPKLLIEEPQTTPDGNLITLLTSKIPLRNSEGMIIGVLGTYMDITERRQAEEALRQSEEKLAGLYASMVEGVALHEIIYENGNTPVDYIITDVNPSFEKIINISRDKALGQKASTLYGTDKAPFLDIYARVASTGKPELFETYFEPLGKHFSISVFSLSKGKFATIFSDITERKRAENELKWNAALLEAQVEASPDGILVVNENGRRILTNERLLNMWGVPDEIRNETDDAPLLDYVVGNTKNPDEFLKKVLYLYDHHSETSRDMIEFKNGMVLDRYSSPVLGKDGSYYGRIWTFRDITENKLAEDRIMASLHEKEVLLKEVHHRVKNNLQIISALLSLQSSYLKDEDLIKIFRDSQNRIKSMALVHENLYMSNDLNKVDFNEYINQLASQLSQSYGDLASKIHFKVNAENVYLNINTAIPCGMIINELVSNSFKYAFSDGRSGEICIDLSSEEEGFKLIVSDNGVGIKGEVNIKESKTLGFRLIDTLVKQIDGDIRFDTINGFKCEIHFKGLK